MEATAALRDKAAMTRLLVLAELQARPGTTLSDVATHVGVTVQAVSTHARALAKAGALSGDYRPTPKGLQHLHEGIRQLSEAVAALAAPVARIEVTSAVAAANVRVGDEVGLVMADGDLAARPGARSPSRGRARNNARAGEEVIVGDLEGVVDLHPGRIRVVSLPSPLEGGTQRVDLRWIKRLLDGGADAARDGTSGRVGAQHRVGAHGTGARIVVRRLLGRRSDFEFAADAAAFNAAERGVDVTLFVSREMLPATLSAFERRNAETLRRVPVELLEAPAA